MNHFAASRDPDVFEEPDRFMPERWMRSTTRTKLQQHPFASLPFGSGSRSCIGWLPLSFQTQFHTTSSDYRYRLAPPGLRPWLHVK